jgi:hypothetical protein
MGDLCIIPIGFAAVSKLNSSKKGGNEVKKLEGPLECEIFASKRVLWSVFQCF